MLILERAHLGAEMHTTAHDALLRFYAREGLPADGNISRPYDWVSVFGVPIPIPNGAARKALLPYHDLHHVVSGYATDEAGEGEVAGWTLGTGEGGGLLGTFYDLGAFAVGVVRYPRRCARAFLRGRQCTNLYHRPLEHWLSLDIDALCTAARTDRPHRGPTRRDRVALAVTTAAATGLWFGVPILGLMGVVVLALG